MPAVGVGGVDVELGIVETEGHTIWDPSERMAMVEVARGNDSVEIIGFNLVFVVGDEEVRHFINESLVANSVGVYYVDLSEYSGDLKSVAVAPVFVDGSEGRISSRFKIKEAWSLGNMPEVENFVKPNETVVSSGGGGGGGGGGGSSTPPVVACVES